MREIVSFAKKEVFFIYCPTGAPSPLLSFRGAYIRTPYYSYCALLIPAHTHTTHSVIWMPTQKRCRTCPIAWIDKIERINAICRANFWLVFFTCRRRSSPHAIAIAPNNAIAEAMLQKELSAMHKSSDTSFDNWTLLHRIAAWIVCCVGNDESEKRQRCECQ